MRFVLRTGGVSASLIAAGFVAVSSLPGEALAQEVCISPAAKSALMQCPAGVLKPVRGRKQEVKINALPPKAPQKTSKPPPIPEVAPGQTRRVQAQAREMKLLITEIQQLETLFQGTPATSPDRAGLLRRLADTYVELESASFRKKTELSIDIDEAKKKAAPTAQKLIEERTKTDKVMAGARRNAIKYYAALSNDHPAYCTHPNTKDPPKSTGCLDETLYFLAYEHEQAGDMAKARKVYLDLIQKKPNSPFVAGAYLAFGELFFNEAQSDPSKWAFAAQSYSEVIKYPLPDNKFFGYAEYKLGYVYWNQTDFGKALSAFKKTIEVGQQYPTIPNAASLADNARRDIVAVYALSGLPKKAYDFLRPLSGDQGNDRTRTLRMMDDLGHAYLDSGKYEDGIDLYTDLLSRDKGPKQCLYQARITEAQMASKSGDKDTIVRALKKQLEAYRKQKGQSPSKDLAKECQNTTAELITETAMAWHLEAGGTGNVRGTNDKKTMDLSAELYDEALSSFDRETFKKLEFPKIVKEDWPSRAKIAYLRADLLYQRKDWPKCGPAFDLAVEEDPTGPDAAAAAYAAVLCYHRVYLDQHPAGSDHAGMSSVTRPADMADPVGPAELARRLAPKEMNLGQKAMLGAFDRYLCYISDPGASDKAAREEYIEIKFARARLYFEAQRWEEAAWAFRDIALSYPDDDSALPAAQLYLESANILGATLSPARPACFEDMGKDVPVFVKSFCTDGKEKTNADDCTVLSRVARGVEAKIPEATAKRAETLKGAEAMKAWEQAATGYFSLWKKYGEAACPSRPVDCNGNDAILYNAARAYQAARLLAKAINVRKILIDPRFGLQETEPARKAVYEIGANYQAIAVYDESATYYERFARENPKMPKAPEALQDAIVLRLGLGQEKEAMASADLFAKSYGSRNPALAARVSYAMGAHLIEKGEYSSAQKRLKGAMSAIDKHATLDVQIQAHAMLGRAYEKLGNKAQAQAQHTWVKNAWSDPAAAQKKLEAAYPDETERTRHLGKTLTAVGESLFFFAEQRRASVDKITFPVYKGSGEKSDVLRHIQTKVAEWVKKKRAAIDTADKEYRKIADLMPAPPPRWTVAAASRVGQMWSKFVAQFRAAPIPKEWQQNGPHPTIPDLTWEEIRMRYYEELDRASEPQKLQAKAAYQGCLEVSIERQHFDENSRTCEVWLSKNYGNEYHLVDEFRGSPSRVADGLKDRAQPVDVQGVPVRK